jgi:hypothetical protein
MATIASPPAPASIAGTAARTSNPLHAGLSAEEAQRRLIEFGPNAIRREASTRPLILHTAKGRH